MSIDEDIEAAWKEADFMPETGSKYEFDAFAAGYRAMAKSLYPLTPADRMVCGVEYMAMLRTDGGCEWKPCVMVSLSNESKVCAWKREEGWVYWDRSAVVLAIDPKEAKLNLPSPSDIFGRGE